MPAACAVGLDQPVAADGLLRHCAEVLLDQILRHTPLPTTFRRRIEHTLLDACVAPTPGPWQGPEATLDTYQRWCQWRERIVGPPQPAAFTLGFRLDEPPAESETAWALQFVVVPKDDPSQRLALADYWACPAAQKKRLRRQLGQDFESRLLHGLGLAARMVPKLWEGLDSAAPQGLALDLDAAFAFLKESAWVLEDAGFKVIVPAWWTPQGHQRLRIRLRSAGGKSARPAAAGSSGLNLEGLVQYRYQLAIGEQAVSEAEWQRLIESKAPLVRLRGQWIELERDKMQNMLAFWRQHGRETPQLSVAALLQRTATDDSFEVDRGDALAEMLERLRD